ncbi:MAG TPA: cyclic nucleotide-binding domain-containing protein [Acidimicrobiia bacterium]|nr:cyclic nucleotide-binding domain-containing protein [Acidimicrobiia bacterium]
MRELRLQPGVWAGLRADFAPRAITTTLLTGLILSLVNVLLATALMSLIYRGELEPFLSTGLGFGLVGSAALALVLALGSSFRGMYGGSQDASTAILGLSAASVAGALVGIAAFETVIAMIVVTALATGFVFLAMGYLGLGDIARFVPFPVIGGLLAGTGYLILSGALGILGVGDGGLVGLGAAGSLWPGLILAVLFFVATRRGWGSVAYLAFLIVAVAGFHVLMPLADVSQADAMGRGWLLGPFPDGSLWPGSILDALAGADWGLIAGEAAGLITILLVVPITLLLYLSALEIETRSDVDVNRELRVTGWGNLAAGALGAPPGYMYFSDTAITSRLVGMRRGPAVVAALVTLAVVAFAGFVLELLPQFVIGGLLLFVGAEFLYEWLWTSRRRMSRTDYALLLAIVVVIAVVGFLPGVAVGLVAAVALFVVRYSRIDVIKHSLTGGDQQSNIERGAEDAEYLQQHGEATLILELQGFIFFGTASRISTRVREALASQPSLRFILCDFRRVSGVDSSAVVVFERIITLASDHDVAFVLTGLNDAHMGQFGDVVSARADVAQVHDDLDHGLAWCEDQLLEESHTGEQTRTLPDDLANDLAPYLVERTLEPGEIMMRQGDPTPGIMLISSGRATVRLDDADGDSVRLRTLLGGTVLGEISLYRDEPCTATVVTDTACEILHLTPDRFADLCREDPELAARLHRFVARTLAGRVSHANRTIRALRD